MSQFADETTLGERLVSTGKLSGADLLDAMETQRLQGGPERKRLGQILVEQGHISEEELLAILDQQGQQVLWCPRCRVQVDVQGTAPGAAYTCQQCGGELQPTPAPRSPVASETWPAMPVPGGDTEDVDEEIRRAMADPRSYVGRYARVEELGRGGMGVVYRCYDPQLHRSVAIKMILESEGADDEGLARFKREALAAAKLQHPGIVTLLEVGEHEGSPYLVMDFVEGRSFDVLLESENPSVRRIVEIVAEVALALHHAHEAGIIHRDVKPQNVMVDLQGKPHVMDFGVARDSSAQQQLTKTGQLLGTPVYMAPEQVGGMELGPWTDIYALGVVLYRVLTGKLPFVADSPPLLVKQILMDEPESLRQLDPTISPDLETITLKCLEKEPERRYPSASAVAQELQRFLDGQAILARPIGRGERAFRWMRKNLALTVALELVVLLVVGGLVAGVYLVSRAEQEAVRRESRARHLAEEAAKEHEEAALVAAAMQKQKEALKQLRLEVLGVLERVRSGEVLENPSDAAMERAKLLKYRDTETVDLLTAELDSLGKRLAVDHQLGHGGELLLEFLCEALWNLGMPEGAVASLGRYLQAELVLPAERRNQLRAVPAGKALCLLGGEEANRLLLQARDGFGINHAFWGQVQRFYKRAGVEPDLESETPGGYSIRGIARYHRGDLDGAIADYTRAIELDPSYAVAWLNRGLARSGKGDLAGALVDYSRGIELDPSNAVALNNRGIAFRAKGDLAGAITDYTRAIEIDPNLAKSWSNRGLARRASGDLDGAIADLSRAIDLDPNFAKAWNNRGLARSDKGDLAGALADHFRAVELDPSYAKAWSNRGSARQAKGDIDGAIADSTRAIELDPNYAVAWTNRGLARRAKGDLDGSLADYTRALELDSSDAATWLNRGVARRSKGDLDGALADYTRAIELYPSFVMAWSNRGNARQAKGDRDGALADFTRAIELDPSFTKAWSNRGYLRLERGDRKGALADYTRALELDPNAATAWYNRGIALQATGDLDGALADYTRAMEIDPSSPETWANRGGVRQAMGDLDGALSDWQRFLELAPGHRQAPVVRAALRRLRLQQEKSGAGR